MLVVDVLVVVEDVIAPGGSDVSGSSVGAADVVDVDVDVVVDVEVALVVVVVVLAEVDVGAAVTADSDGSSVAGCDGKPCASAAPSAASAAVVAVSGCATAVVTAPSAVGAELLLSLLSVEHAAASRAADSAVASRIFLCSSTRSRSHSNTSGEAAL